MTTSHLTNPAKDAGQVIGYSHSTKLSKDDSQVAGYRRANCTASVGRLSPPSLTFEPKTFWPGTRVSLEYMHLE
jgi:hypothetical protein